MKSLLADVKLTAKLRNLINFPLRLLEDICVITIIKLKLNLAKFSSLLKIMLKDSLFGEEYFKQKRMEDKLRHLSKSGRILQPICFIFVLGGDNADKGIVFNH